ncbi:hypothetical protein GTR04_5125 [Trichophyton interdigitale]|uniref:Uncharacterized protein n=2 Tax=Trichophyton interdigitale TaxID=101480 RepID=A0A9P4YET6_9EURO|nr:hypothetical protein H101_05050 [Trichophyton interdigitale H6]KAF3892121.1 hypothetical protein GY632_4790 [Trichophyton interdigitale]KAF3892158.1 hypothetical protein GY631_4366 [Trichophyton interdigitale]KAG8207483.1 hypothetical protein GTR04_5125 [Trichophyton interdigitale]KDB25650.1 hypothetical protein H109_02513 [Trichophyton interdigitale MR816]
MKFQAVLVFFAGALALAAPIEERALPVVGTLGSAAGLAIVTLADQLFKAGKVAPSAVDNLPAGGIVKGLPVAGGLLGGGAVSFPRKALRNITQIGRSDPFILIGDITSHFGYQTKQAFADRKTVTHSNSVNGIASDFAGKVMDSRASLLVIPLFSVLW